MSFKSRFYLIICACLITVSGFFGCKSKQEADEAHPLVVAYTSGVISILSPVRVVLTNDAEERSFQPGEPVKDGVFKFSPSVSGKAYWINENTIEFKPDDAFKAGQEYMVKFHVSDVTKVGDAPKTFTFKINTIIPTFYSQLDGLSLYNRTTPNLYYLTGSITASDYIPTDKIKSLLSIQPNKWNVKWEHDYAENKHYFRIDSIRSVAKKYDITFEWDGKSIGYQFNNTDKLTIPGEDEFSLIDIQVVNSPDQYVQCTFSEPIDEKQRLISYFSLSNNVNLRFAVELNTVKIYPTTRQTGTYNLTIEKGLKTTTGRKLSESATHEVVFEQLKPAVKFVGKGAILPNSKGLHLTFQAVNYQSVDVTVFRIYENNILQFLQTNRLDGDDEMYRVGKEILNTRINLAEKKAVNLTTWNTYSLDLASLITPEPGAIYRITLSGHSKLGGSSDDDDDYDYYEYYRERRARVRNVLATDIGITAKAGDNGLMYTMVSNLVSAEPISGVSMKVYDYVNQLIGEGTTDKDGMATIKTSGTPYVIVGQQGKQKAYLRVDEGYPLSLSNFDVSGTTIQRGLKGYIYGERGVWRPGDTLFLAFMLEDKNKTLPANHPVNFELRDPNGQVANKQVKTSGTNGLYRFTTPTSADALTGEWYANITVGGETFSKTLKIETVKPNRLKIDVKLDHTPLLSSEGLSGKVAVHWLHGAVAKNMDIRINARISQMKTSFKDHKDYNFDDPSKIFYTEEQTLVEGKLDSNGELSLDSGIDLENAPGMLRMFLSTRVFEEGGDFSIDEFTTTYSPYKSYVGIMPPEGDGYYHRLDTDTEQVFQIATLDETGKPVNRRNLKVDIYKVDWSWWWSSVRGRANYSHSGFRTPTYSATINSQNGKGVFKHTWNNYGNYVVQVTDPESGHSTASSLYIGSKYWWGGDDDGEGGGATMLQFKTDKPSYSVGEEAVVTVPSSAGAKALVSIEAGAEVKRAYWVDCKDKETRIAIPTTADMVPNVFVHISLIQPHAQTNNDAPMRLYGVVPVMVEDPSTRLEPVINMPEELRPETPFKVKVSEKNGQLMTYTLAIVDDGLLGLTRFKTPDPWNIFYAREALGVKTWDLYDMVIGAYGGKIEQLFAIGGDEDGGGDESSKPKAQRFRPVVKYIGPFTIEKGKSNEHNITLPPYIGSVRTMVIATNGRGFGSSQKTTPVRKPLMTLATLPRVIGPGEEVWVPITVFTMEDRIKQVDVEVKANEFFQIEGGRKKSINFSGQGDQTVYFKLKIKDNTGIGKVTAMVSGGGEKAEHAIEIDIRNPNPLVSNFEEKLVEAGKEWIIDFALPGMNGTNKATIEASYIPPINLGRRLSYLINYPHGCIEQTTSSAFPQLYLDNVMDMNAKSKQEIENNMKAALNRLRLFVTPEGGFGYWPGNNTPDSWGSSYAGHFMLEAESKGYALPTNLKSNWLRYQTNRARNWRSNEGGDLEQAYRLYTLALAKQPDLSAMNRLKEYDKLSISAKWRLAAAYALAGKPEVGKALTSNVATSIEPYSRFSNHYGTPERDQAMILETLTLLQDRTAAFVMVKKVSDALNGNQWMGTQTTAYCLMAVSKYAAGEKGSKQINVEYTSDGKQQSAKSDMPVWEASLDVKNKTGKEKMKFTNKSSVPLFVRITASGIPAPGNEKSFANELSISVRYFDTDGNTLDVTRLTQGTDFRAEVTVQNPGRMGYYSNMILSQIFPSGWEIINTRLNNEDGSSASSQRYDYIDIRDDRVYTYFGISTNSSKTFTVPLSAAYSGRFYLPAFSCEAMYDASIIANNEGKWVEVVQ